MKESCRNIKGFTLVELIVVMAVFLVIITVAAQTFNTIITNSVKYSKSEESNIEGVIGLEVMRHDLEQMGVGLPWKFKEGSAISYTECENALGKELNDASGIPRAFAGREGYGEFGSDFLAIKASTVGVSSAALPWTYIPYGNYSTASGRESRPVSWSSMNVQTGTKVTAIRMNFNDATDDHILMEKAGSYSFNYATDGTIDSAFLPENDQQTHYVYGISTTTPRMPFNRADFFINYSSSGAPSPPQFCAEKTGTLFKAVVKHSDGQYTYIPLLDCVADMQVILGWDTSDEGKANMVDAYSSVPTSDGTVTASPSGAASIIKGWLTPSAADPAKIPRNIREHLKVIKVYILAQEGRRDRYYSYPESSIVVGKDCKSAESTDIDCGSSFTRTYTFSAEQRRFHWKLYRIIVRPKNLVSNQR